MQECKQEATKIVNDGRKMYWAYPGPCNLRSRIKQFQSGMGPLE